VPESCKVKLKDKKNMQPPIFIVGPPRSGTTLTAKILGRHSRIFMPGETHFFDDIYARRGEVSGIGNSVNVQEVIQRLSNLYHRYYEPEDQQRIEILFQDSRTFDGLEAQMMDYKHIFAWFMEIQMRSEGKQRWGNNTPRDIFNIKDILNFFPNAKIIICVRDIRDFMVSYQNKWRQVPKAYWNRMQNVYHPVVTSILWKASIRQINYIKDVMSKENYIIIKYENLVEKPETVVAEICNVIGEEFEDDMLDITFSNSSFDLRERGIFSSSIGRWQEILHPEEVAIAHTIAGKELRQFGYEVPKVDCSVLKLFRIFVNTPFAFFKACKVTSNTRGDMLRYFIRRSMALLK
jgi:hypothetical protein